MRGVLLYTFFMLFADLAFGQSGQTRITPQEAKIGQSIMLEYSLEMPSNGSFLYNPFGSIVPSRKKAKGGTLATELSSDLELLSEFKDTVILLGKTKKWVGTYEITGWNEGEYVITGSKIIVNDSTIEFPSANLTLKLVDAKSGKDIFDIREDFADLPEHPNKYIEFFKGNFLWILLVIVLLMMLVILYFRRKKEALNAPVKLLSLKERSLLAIDALEKERMWEKGKLKEHYIELSFILRSYLSARYELNILENTTHNAQLLLTRKGLHTETVQVIGTVLDQSDLVKFARSAPEEIEVLKVSQMVRQIIAETSPLEFENAE